MSDFSIIASNAITLNITMTNTLLPKAVNNFCDTAIDKYAGVPFIILDIPKFEMDDNFEEIWKTSAVPVVRLKPDYRYTLTPEQAGELERTTGRLSEYTTPNWVGFNALETEKVDVRFARSLVDGKAVLPKFFEQLYEYLPAREITQVLFWSNQRPIGLHRDLREQYPFPSSLRLMIDDENPEPTFWLQPRPEGSNGDAAEKIKFDEATAKFVDTRNAESNAFVYNNKDWLHGARKDPAYSKILCSISLSWDYSKYGQLLDRSIKRYGNNR
jgi:hypothetical protein